MTQWYRDRSCSAKNSGIKISRSSSLTFITRRQRGRGCLSVSATSSCKCSTWHILNLRRILNTMNQGGVKMENQKKPLLIRPSRTHKTIPNNNFCPKSFPSMGASKWLSSCDFSCDFSKILHNFHKTFSKQPRFIWMGHESIHLSLASPALGFVWLLPSFCAHSRQRLWTKILFGICFMGPRGPN